MSEIKVQTRINMTNMEDIINQLESFVVDSSPITVGDFAKNAVNISESKHRTKGPLEYLNEYALAATAMSPTLSAAKHFVTRSKDDEADSGNVNYCNIQEQFVGTIQVLRMSKTILLVMIYGD